jgi:hypothetical protein
MTLLLGIENTRGAAANRDRVYKSLRRLLSEFVARILVSLR